MITSRREILNTGLSGVAAVSLSSMLPKISFAAPTQKVSEDNILVIVQLSGGNDGLNTVIPTANDTYFKARPTLALKKNTLKLTEDFALNPGMTAFKELFDAGHLAIINGCGYPQPNRSHFQAMHIWHTADPRGEQQTGWLGNYLDQSCLKSASANAPAINIGHELPHALRSNQSIVPSIDPSEDYHVRSTYVSQYEARHQNPIADLNAIRHESSDTQPLNAITSEQIRQLAENYKLDADYPQNLGDQLKLIAQFISADLGTRIFYCQVAGFDTHASQLASHENLLRNVASSIAAFHKDMTAKGYGDKIAVMCFSEFGRRLIENNSQGTDHGTAAPMFVTGNKIQGGIYGAYPSLTDTDYGDLKYTTDFRRVYATLLDGWLRTNSTKILGKKFETLPIV